MDIKKVVVGDLEENCYIVSKGNRCLVIDPGDEFSKIDKELKGKEVVGCLITHYHPDHIGALEELLSKYDIEVNKDFTKEFEYEVIHTPGHTYDSKIFYFKKNNIMFTGDFIFQSSIGRTDLGGNDLDMQESLEKIKLYPDKTILYPGHGEATTLGEEKPRFKYYY